MVIDTQHQNSEVLQEINVALIQGEYNTTEGMNIACQLLEEKIKFLQMKNFSCQICSGEKDEKLSKRIEELKEARNKVKQLFDEHKEGECKFSIQSTISIKKIEE